MATERFKNLTVLLLVILYAIAIISCSRKPSFSINESDLIDLLIPIEAMPIGWQVEFPAGRYMDSYYSEIAVKVVFLPVNGIKDTRTATGHSIHVFSDSKTAEIKFQGEFAVRAVNSDEFIPDGWVHPDLSANADEFSCESIRYKMNLDQFLRCEWIARYDQYIIEFGSWVLPEIMSLDDIQRIIIEIDQDLVNEFKK